MMKRDWGEKTEEGEKRGAKRQFRTVRHYGTEKESARSITGRKHVIGNRVIVKTSAREWGYRSRKQKEKKNMER